VVTLAASTGVTFMLFFATTLYPAGPLLAELKIGALLTGAGVRSRSPRRGCCTSAGSRTARRPGRSDHG